MVTLYLAGRGWRRWGTGRRFVLSAEHDEKENPERGKGWRERQFNHIRFCVWRTGA